MASNSSGVALGASVAVGGTVPGVGVGDGGRAVAVGAGVGLGGGGVAVGGTGLGGTGVGLGGAGVALGRAAAPAGVGLGGAGVGVTGAGCPHAASHATIKIRILTFHTLLASFCTAISFVLCSKDEQRLTELASIPPTRPDQIHTRAE